jgi:hypothetical protein
MQERVDVHLRVLSLLKGISACEVLGHFRNAWRSSGEEGASVRPLSVLGSALGIQSRCRPADPVQSVVCVQPRAQVALRDRPTDFLRLTGE